MSTIDVSYRVCRVHRHRDQETYTSLLMNSEEWKLTYPIGVRVYPRRGYIYAFKELDDAKLFNPSVTEPYHCQYDFVILRGFGERVQDDPIYLGLINWHDQHIANRDLNQFWKYYEQGIPQHPMTILTPDLPCVWLKWFEAREVISYKSMKETSCKTKEQ